MLVADYVAPGNYQGQYQANVFPAKSTSQASTSASTTKASASTGSSSRGKSIVLTTDAQARSVLAKSGTTLVLIWQNMGCPVNDGVKVKY